MEIQIGKQEKAMISRMENTNVDRQQTETVQVKEEKNWSSAQVENWMKKCKVNSIIIESLLPCDGRVLHQIYIMMKTNPEFFYSSMKNSGLNSLKDLKDIAYFSNELMKLFEK